MKLTNQFILTYTEELHETIIQDNETRYPAKVNYSIQKNYRTLMEIYKEIMQERERICQEYSTSFNDGIYEFADARLRESAQRELDDLLSLEQDVNIIKFNIDSFGNLALTAKQMDVLMFFIEEE